jgi:hypothetical protein
VREREGREEPAGSPKRLPDMPRPKLPPQILRLVLLTIMIVGSYLIARAFLTPASFGEYGWYRADALEEVASRIPVHAGRKACEECHSEIFPKLAKGPHKTLSCEACHGVSSAHAANPDIKPGLIPEHVLNAEVKKGPIPAAAADPAAVSGRLTGNHCIRCHDANPSRPSWFKQIVIKDHYAGKCIECHMPHQPNDTP